jgi:hypothetical protein
VTLGFPAVAVAVAFAGRHGRRAAAFWSRSRLRAVVVDARQPFYLGVICEQGQLQDFGPGIIILIHDRRPMTGVFKCRVTRFDKRGDVACGNPPLVR